MEMKECASKLGIDVEGTLEGEKYVIELANSNEYSRVYTLLDKSELVNIDEDSTLVTENVGELLFLGDEFDIKLVGNFAQDIYRIVITVGE
jgi:hypothetical protein